MDPKNSGMERYHAQALSHFVNFQSVLIVPRQYPSVSKWFSHIIVKIKLNCLSCGHHSIANKSSAYGAKGPWFETRWRQKIHILKLFVLFFRLNAAPIGANLLKK